MKLTDFNELWRAVNKINIDIVAKTELGILEDEGLDTDLSNVFTTDDGELFTILKNGDIRKVIIHICNIREYEGEYKLPKFHIFECQTITRMRKNNRGHRYKMASKLDGKFTVYNPKKSREVLDICNFNCLSQYNSVYHKNKTVKNFNLKKYLQEPIKHTQAYIKVDDDMTTIPDDYANNWQNISYERKKYHKWICQECFMDFSANEKKRFLHTHHIDANKSNNGYENLKVLCIECHSNEFNHGHIKDTSSYHEFLKYKERL